MAIIQVLLGLALVAFGRKLFWLFVGVVGFIAGVSLANTYFSAQPQWVQIVIALLAGLVGAGLAVLLQRLAVAVAGFLAGGYLAITLMNIIGLQVGKLSWLPYVIGGVIGAILVVVLFDWALILLSSLVGASLVVQVLQVSSLVNTIIFLILLVVGILIQAGTMQREGSPPVSVSEEEPISEE